MTGLAETALSKVKEAYKLLPDEPVIRFAYAELFLIQENLVKRLAYILS